MSFLSQCCQIEYVTHRCHFKFSSDNKKVKRGKISFNFNNILFNPTVHTTVSPTYNQYKNSILQLVFVLNLENLVSFLLLFHISIWYTILEMWLYNYENLFYILFKFQQTRTYRLQLDSIGLQFNNSNSFCIKIKTLNIQQKPRTREVFLKRQNKKHQSLLV